MTTTVTTTGITFADSTTQTTAATSGLAGLFGQTFTSNGTFTVPSGVTAVKVTVIGGGGGGGGGSTNGTAGGTSSFGSFVSCAGGGGGVAAGAGGTGGAVTLTGVSSSYTYPAGNGSGALLGGCGYIPGNGGAAGMPNYNSYYYTGGANIAQGPFGAGGVSTIYGTFVFSPVGQGSGGGPGPAAGGGGGGGLCIAYITGLTSGSSITVTTGGAGTGGSSPTGQNGTVGMVIVEW